MKYPKFSKATIPMRSDFAAFILTHGRPDRVHTYVQLRKSGYTGRIYLIVDDEDKTVPDYIKKFGPETVIQFSKEAISKKFDEAGTFNDRRAIVYARNASWDIAKQLGLRYIVQLDDDYMSFLYRRSGNVEGEKRESWPIKNLDRVFTAMIEAVEATGAVIAMSQGGDHGKTMPKCKYRRKAMNSFVLDVSRPFNFMGRLNEDVTTYVVLGSRGKLFLTYIPLQLTQKATQSNAGGMTELYKESGTYLKSFYTVMHAPSCVRIAKMGRSSMRYHHHIDWDKAVPKIVRQSGKVV
jgi:hypothetical protein